MNEWLTVITSSPGADADGEQREVQRGGAVRHRAGVRRADERGELALERRDLRPLGDPARAGRPSRAASTSASPSTGLAIGIMAPAPAASRCAGTPRARRATTSTRSRRPSSSGIAARKPSSRSRLAQCRPAAAAPD